METKCGLCGGSMVRNPHPDSGNPDKYLEVGPEYVCVACTFKALNSWAERAGKKDEECQTKIDRIVQFLKLIADATEIIIYKRERDNSMWRLIGGLFLINLYNITQSIECNDLRIIMDGKEIKWEEAG